MRRVATALRTFCYGFALTFVIVTEPSAAVTTCTELLLVVRPTRSEPVRRADADVDVLLVRLRVAVPDVVVADVAVVASPAFSVAVVAGRFADETVGVKVPLVVAVVAVVAVDAAVVLGPAEKRPGVTARPAVAGV